MNKHYDNIDDLTLETKIIDQKDGYYAFEDTVFFGAKGGQEADRGTINGQEVLDLKWEGDQLYHRVAGPLDNPILLQVDKETRYINTTVQTALHYLDGFYNDRGMVLIAVGVTPDHQWYELDSDQVTPELLEETEAFMADVISQNIPTTFSYMAGEDYLDEFYQQFDELRLVHLGDYNSQPCGTPHVKHSGQIGSFTILDTESTKQGTKVHFAVYQPAQDLFKKYFRLAKDLSHVLNTSDEETLDRVKDLVANQKELKNQIKQLKKDYFDLKGQALAQEEAGIIDYPIEDRSDLQLLAQAMNRHLHKDKIILSTMGTDLYFAFLSGQGQARTMMDKLKEVYPQAKGGGSPKIVTGSITSLGKDDLKPFFESLLN